MATTTRQLEPIMSTEPIMLFQALRNRMGSPSEDDSEIQTPNLSSVSHAALSTTWE